MLISLLPLLESRSLGSSSAYDDSTGDEGSHYWTEWSTCSVTCGSGMQKRLLCGGVGGCSVIITTESQGCYKGSCSTDVEWSDWSECDMGWFMMTRTRCHEDVCEEEYLECELEGGGTWSEWGDCIDGFQEREKCGVDYGCEIEEQECSVVGELDIIDKDSLAWHEVEWSAWEPCENGFSLRRKCIREVCASEEKVCEDTLSGSWSAWEQCKKGKKLRTRCSYFLGCEIEEVSCANDERKYSGHWSAWGTCSGGYQSRERCVAGYGCDLEERECGGLTQQSGWTDWGPCKEGYQFRERCSFFGCEEEHRSCGKRALSSWSEWGACNGGYQERSKCDGLWCSSEERPCEHEMEDVPPTDNSWSWGDWISF